MSVVIKPCPTGQARDLAATVRYMIDIKNDGAKVPYDAYGQSMSGALNCASKDRSRQIKEITTLLKLHANIRSTQAASHQIISYPKGFIPTRKQVKQDIQIYLKKLGMQNYLLLWDCHNNTANFHIHILLCRVSPTSDKQGKYPIANNGLVKKNDRKTKRIRTCEASCRQAAIAEICNNYGWEPPEGLTHDANGKELYPKKKKDKHSEKTKAGERKTGEKSRERQLSEAGYKVFMNSRSWLEIDQKLASMAIEMTIKIKNDKAYGGYLTGPDGRKCSFSKCGKDCSYPALKKRFGVPTFADAAAISTDQFSPFQYKDEITMEAAKSVLNPIFTDTFHHRNWDKLLNQLPQGMELRYSGGGLIVVFNQSKNYIKTSSISNKYSLSKLEKIMGPCPLPKPQSKRQSDDVAECTINQVDNDARTQGFNHLEKQAERALKQWHKQQELEAARVKNSRLNILSLFAAAIKFQKLKNEESQNVHQNSSKNHQKKSEFEKISSGKPLFVM